MNFQQRIESKLFTKKNPTPKEAFENICFILVHEYHWTMEDILETPSPLVLALVDNLITVKKKEQQEMKKRR